MKRFWLGIIGALIISVQAWGITATGMPALDDLRADVEKNGKLSQRLGFSEKQREKILELIEEESEDLIKLRDESVAKEKKLDKAKKSKNKGNIAAAKRDFDDAYATLHAARDKSFEKLSTVVDEKQFKGLKKWRAEGNAKAN